MGRPLHSRKRSQGGQVAATVKPGPRASSSNLPSTSSSHRSMPASIKSGKRSRVIRRSGALACMGLVVCGATLFTACIVGLVPAGFCRQLPLYKMMERSIKGTRAQAPDLYSYQIVRSFPHDKDAFTQGLVLVEENTLYESTGLYGQSSLRKVDLQSGKVLNIRHLQHHHFGEGLALAKGRLLQVLWRTNQGFAYDPDTFDQVATFHTPMEDGWGLAFDGTHVIGSDGTDKIYFFDPETFKESRRLQVHDGSHQVASLNELEYIDGEIWANIWQKDCIARISPEDGRVLGWVLLHGLREEAAKQARNQQHEVDVLNGIAWDAKNRRLFVTGKLWPTMFEISLRNIIWPVEVDLQNARDACISR